MKVVLIILSYLLLSFTPGPGKECCSKKGGRCTGSAVCSACTSCNYCKHCNAGGTCGTCKKTNNVKSGKLKSASVQQCKATTKKGTRCSRAPRSGSYCWQHGG